MDESELSNQLQIRLWEKLSRFSWMPFEEAREYVSKLKFKSSTEFTNHWRKGKLPKNIPSKPRVAYLNEGFVSMPDFLGYDSLFQDWMPFEIAREFVRELGLKSEKDWESYAKSELRPFNLPKTPFNVYKNKGFISMPDFLGYDSKFQEWLDYDEALIFVQSLKLKSTNEWRQYTKSQEYNVLIPKAPNNHYRNKGWVNFGTWLGTHVISDNLKKYFTYEEAKSFLKLKNLTSKEDFNKFKNQESFPGFIPKMPDIKYRKTGEWKGWPDFLSYTRKHKWDFLPFEEAREMVRNLNLKNSEEWRKYTKSDNFPKNIPKAPGLVYLDEWLGIGDWLGTGRIADHKKVFLTFEEARKLARSFDFKKMNEWKSFQNSKDFPNNLPKSPDNVYKDKGWVSWPDFLGYEKNEFYEFNEARKIVHSLKLKNQSQWYLYCKSSNFDPKLPKSPKSVYKKYWKDMGDWLDTNTIAPQNRVFLDFESAKKLIKKLKIANTDDWKKLRKLNLIPDSIPSNPDKKYKDNGWKGWADFLGKDEK